VKLLAIAAVAGVGLTGVSSAGATRAVRGFDGTTITLAGMGAASLFPKAEVGARARVQRFNTTNEVKGIKLELTEVADDKRDPATSVSEARRLVSQVGAFAIVPAISFTVPVDFFEQQHVPYFGGGFDTSYCSKKPSTKLWGFSVTGCSVAEDPSFVMTLPGVYSYVSKESGKKRPTIAITSSDDSTGVNTSKNLALRLQGSGLRVVSVTNNAPASGVSDFAPYVNQVMTADDGAPPDAVFCLFSTSCIGFWSSLQASGFTGAFVHPLFSDALVKAMDGTVVNASIVNPRENTPGYAKIKADLEAYQPGSSATLDMATIYGYASIDAFAKALKKVAAEGESNITPENVRKVASTMSWGIKGVMGPYQYPKSTVMTYPACATVMLSNGTQWETVEPYLCTTKSVSPNVKVG
jgi:ABC-type branched-subunit amino acid transport system substrate-binding protein